MRSWAFATSPYGLGLSERRFWSLSGREFTALKRVWGESLALEHNAHFRADIPWVADDFVIPGSRDRRLAAKVHDDMEAVRINSRLAVLTEDDVPAQFKELG